MSTRIATIIVFFSLSLAWLPNVTAWEWTDVTGQHRVDAELIEFTDGVVRLRKEDGQVIAVPLEELSLADRDFVPQKSVNTAPPEQKPAKAANAIPLKKKMPNQEDTLQGLWRVKSVAAHETGPKKAPQAGFSSLVHVEGDKATFLCVPIDEDGIKKWTLKVLPDQVPKGFELTRGGPPVPKKHARFPDTLPGTYEFVDDVLRIGLRMDSLGEFREPSSAAVEEQTLVIELERVGAEHAETLMALQGLWKMKEMSAIVLVEGEGVRGMSKGEPGDWAAFRLHGRAKPGDAKALSEAAKMLSSADVTDVREVTLFQPSRTAKAVNGLIARTDDGEMVFSCRELTGALLWERATTEDLAAVESKRVMSVVSTTWLLTQKKSTLQEFVAKYPDTQAAAEVGQELKRMPPDEEIRELDAAKYLKYARGFFDRQDRLRAKHDLQLIIDQYPDTEAAKNAKEELAATTSLEEALEIRVGNQALGDQRLEFVIRDYPGTKAASEAKRVLDEAIQRKKMAEKEREASQAIDAIKQQLWRDGTASIQDDLREFYNKFSDTKAAIRSREDPEIMGVRELSIAIQLLRVGKPSEEEARKHLAAAIEHYREALKLNKNHLPAQLGLGWCLDEAGDKAAAVESYRKALALAWKKEGNQDYYFYDSFVQETAHYLLPLLDPEKDAQEIENIKGYAEAIRKKSRAITPLVIPLEDNATLAELVDCDASVRFDLDGSGFQRPWGWITSKAAWLVWDPHGSGKITSGLQMFGNVTFWIFWKNGYEALSALDDNGDGCLSGHELEGLTLWHDRNSDGVSDPGEVETVEFWGIQSLSCHFRRHPAGIVFSPRGVVFQGGATRPTYDWIAPSRYY